MTSQSPARLRFPDGFMWGVSTSAYQIPGRPASYRPATSRPSAPVFGLVHVDYETQRRTVKDSGAYLARVAAGNALDAQRWPPSAARACRR